MKQFDFENINQKRDFYLNKQEKKIFTRALEKFLRVEGVKFFCFSFT